MNITCKIDLRSDKPIHEVFTPAVSVSSLFFPNDMKRVVLSYYMFAHAEKNAVN
jgi:hypothetical protein